MTVASISLRVFELKRKNAQSFIRISWRVHLKCSANIVICNILSFVCCIAFRCNDYVFFFHPVSSKKFHHIPPKSTPHLPPPKHIQCGYEGGICQSLLLLPGWRGLLSLVNIGWIFYKDMFCEKIYGSSTDWDDLFLFRPLWLRICLNNLRGVCIKEFSLLAMCLL